MSKAQASILAIAIAMFIVIAIISFSMLTSIRKERINEFNNIYVHNLLLTVMRSTTGYASPCHTFSDTMVCCYFTPNKRCSQKRCIDICEEDLKERIENLIKPSFSYFLSIEPEGFEYTGGSRVFIGNDSVEDAYPVYVANEKVITSYESDLRIKLIIAEI